MYYAKLFRALCRCFGAMTVIAQMKVPNKTDHIVRILHSFFVTVSTEKMSTIHNVFLLRISLIISVEDSLRFHQLKRSVRALVTFEAQYVHKW